MAQAAKIASVGGQKVGQPAMADVCNGMERKKKSAAIVPALTLAIKYSWLKQRYPNQRLSPVQFGCDDELKQRRASAPTSVVSRRPKWIGICPALAEMQNVRIEQKAERLPVGTTVFPNQDDADIRMAIDAAYRKMTALINAGTADPATKVAHALGEAAWKEQPGVLSGDAASYLRGHWNRSAGETGAPALKKAALCRLNMQQDAAPAGSAAGIAALPATATTTAAALAAVTTTTGGVAAG